MSLMDVDSVRHGQALRLFALVVVLHRHTERIIIDYYLIVS